VASIPAGDVKRGFSLKDIALVAISLGAIVIAVWYVIGQFQPVRYSFEIPDAVLESNQDNITAEQLLDLPLVDEQGQPVSLRERQNSQHLVIVFTRGSMAAVKPADRGPQLPNIPNVCPYCSSQASGIASLMTEFTKEQAQVLLVFPVTELAQNADAATFLKSTVPASNPPPFPVLLDLKLQAVEQLGLREHLARPASFIIDKAGDLRFAYVAQKGSADRPSGGELLRRIKQLNTANP